jgi:uncharacterized protein (DUF1501 family)
MLRILGSQRALCDGVSRRDFLRVGALGGLGLASGASAAPAGPIPSFGRAKSVILLFLYGGASQLETFDPKPDAPVEIRGRLGSIATTIPGYRICEGLPRVARMIDRCTVIRSMTHPYPIHGTAFSVASAPALDTPMQDNPRDPRHWPFIGSVVDYVESRQDPSVRPPVPRNIALPFLHSSRRKHPIHNAGPYGAFLGRAFDPVWTEFEGEGFHKQKYHFGGDVATVADPYGGIHPNARFVLGKADAAPPAITLDRLDGRHSLLEQLDLARRALDGSDQVKGFARNQDLAFALSRAPKFREAIDLGRESAAVRERYGMTLFGQGCLVARRLVEAGGRFITVFWDEYGSVNSAWDTHYWHYPRLTQQLLPGFDMAFSALVDDLEVRGLLDETLIVCTTEHGRTPKLDRDGDHPSGTGQGGRNHWSRAYSTVLAGAGVCRGKLVGKTDRIASDVTECPVSPKDVLATTYHLAGIDPAATIADRFGQPRPIGGDGRVLNEVIE